MTSNHYLIAIIASIIILSILLIYLKGRTDKQNEILANRKKNKYKRIDDIEQVKERIKEGKL